MSTAVREGTGRPLSPLPRPAGPPPLPELHELTIVRDEPAGDLRQVFLVPVGGRVGRCWIAMNDALAVGAFGRGWVARELVARRCRIGPDALAAELLAPEGLRLRTQPTSD